MNAAAVDRIFHRLTLLRGGTATAVGDRAWDVSIPADLDAEDGPTLDFRCQLTVEGDRVTAVHSDAPLDSYTPDQATAVTELQTDLAAGLVREGITFGSFDELSEFIVSEVGGTAGEDTVEIAPEGEDGEPVFASLVAVAREPWVSLSTPFVDDVDPEWLLAQNGDLTHMHFEAFEGGVTLACAFPLALLTGQRVLELLDDMFSFRERLLEELEEGDDEEG